MAAFSAVIVVKAKSVTSNGDRDFWSRMALMILMVRLCASVNW